MEGLVRTTCIKKAYGALGQTQDHHPNPLSVDPRPNFEASNSTAIHFQFEHIMFTALNVLLLSLGVYPCVASPWPAQTISESQNTTVAVNGSADIVREFYLLPIGHWRHPNYSVPKRSLIELYDNAKQDLNLEIYFKGTDYVVDNFWRAIHYDSTHTVDLTLQVYYSESSGSTGPITLGLLSDFFDDGLDQIDWLYDSESDCYSQMEIHMYEKHPSDRANGKRIARGWIKAGRYPLHGAEGTGDEPQQSFNSTIDAIV